jgi:hypothetical protein
VEKFKSGYSRKERKQKQTRNFSRALPRHMTVCHVFLHSVDRAFLQSVDQAFLHSVDQAFLRSVDRAFLHSMDRAFPKM